MRKINLSSIGEFGLIERFKKHIRLDASVVAGSGDDCAVLKLDKKHYQLFTCDMMVEGEDFTTGTDSYLVGRKALAISISDIAACGGIPCHCVISLGLPAAISIQKIDRLAKGLFDLARAFKINVVGGDISKANRLVIDVALLGRVEKKCLILRSGAHPGDLIFVTGKLGGSIRGKHLTFTPRLKEARFLSTYYSVHSMIDISDGLAQDLGHIIEASGVGAMIYEDFLPISPDAKNLQDALTAGEDFELLFTLPFKRAQGLYKKYGGIFKPIGLITEKKCGVWIIDRYNNARILKPKGFTHF